MQARLVELARPAARRPRTRSRRTRPTRPTSQERLDTVKAKIAEGDGHDRPARSGDARRTGSRPDRARPHAPRATRSSRPTFAAARAGGCARGGRRARRATADAVAVAYAGRGRRNAAEGRARREAARPRRGRRRGDRRRRGRARGGVGRDPGAGAAGDVLRALPGRQGLRVRDERPEHVRLLRPHPAGVGGEPDRPAALLGRPAPRRHPGRASAELRPGDLLTYGPDGSEHVVLYIGAGWDVEAKGVAVGRRRRARRHASERPLRRRVTRPARAVEPVGGRAGAASTSSS